MPESKTKPWEDAPLVKQAKSGNADAFGQLYDHYAPKVFRFLYAQLPDRMDAEDLTTEVFMQAWRSLASYEERGFAFSAFLFRIARNLVADFYRKRKNLVDSEILEHVSDDRLSLSQSVMLKQEHRELYKTLSQLNDNYRTVLVLRFLNELSPQETARAMQRSEGAIRVLQHRALSALRELINDHGLQEKS